MSAFYDIWISNDPPAYTRLDNIAWKRQPEPFVNTWVSLPQGKQEYIHQYDNEVATITVLGQFYEYVDQATLLDSCIGYIENTQNVFADPAGHYCLLVYHKQKKEHYVFTNRLGTYHVYYLSKGSQNVISTYFLGLARSAKDKQLDWEGITGFMAMGFFPGTTTYLEGISVLENSSCYTFNQELELIEHKKYREWNFEMTQISQADLLEEFNSILSSSLTYSTKDKRVALPISGGLDSRTIVGNITHNPKYKTLWGFSYGYTEKSVENKIASKIANARKIDFNSFKVPNYLFDNIDSIADSVELFQYIDGTRQAFMKDKLIEKSDVTIGGHWGDVWFDDAGIDDMSEESYFYNKIVKKGSSWLLKEICEPYYAKHRDFLKNYFSDWMSKYKHIGNKDYKMKIFKTNQWSFRWTVPSIRMYQAAVMPILPFYDNRIVDFFSKVDTSLLKGRALQVEYIKQYHSDLAKIKWQEYDRNLYNYKKYNNRNLSYRAYKKLLSTFSNKKPTTRNWEVFYLNANGKKNLEDILLHNKPFAEIVPVEKSRQLLTDFYDYPTAANGYKISMLHTLAQFMKKVF